MAARLLPVLRQKFTDSNGQPLSGGKLYSYIAGTATPLATYTDQAGETPNTNPVILDANGEANVWIIGGSYKFVLTDSNDVPQWTVDHVNSTNGGGATEADAAAEAAAEAQAAAAGVADVADQVTAAQTAASDAASSAGVATGMASAASNSAASANTSATSAGSASSQAQTYAGSAQTYASNAATSANNAALSESNALGYKNAAQTAASAAQAVVPDQTGNSGKYLKTDGSAAAWAQPTKTDVGLANVDNTSDAGKPVSTAQQTALNLKADSSTLTAHTGNTANPHNVTATQVGNTTGQWNAAWLQSVGIDTTTPVIGQVLKFNGTSWSPGVGGGSGSKNYITGGDGESGNIGVLYANGAAIPTTASGGSPTAARSTTTTNPLSGASSNTYTPGALGNGLGIPMIIDREDFGTILQVDLSYEIATYANYTDGDLSIYVIAPSGAVIQPSGFKIMKASGPTKAQPITFQTEITGTNYIIAIHQTTATTTWGSLKYEIKCGPTTKTQGAFISAWESFTPVSSVGTTNVTYTGWRRRVGEMAEVQITANFSGAPTGTNVTLDAPTGWTLDWSKLTAPVGYPVTFGRGILYDASVGSYDLVVNNNGSNTSSAAFLLQLVNASGTYDTFTNLNSGASPAAFATGDKFTVSFAFPVVGWGNSMQLSTDNDGRAAGTKVNFSATAGSSGSYVALGIASATNDTHGGVSGNTYVVKQPGFYTIGSLVNWASTAFAAGDQLYVGYKINSGAAVTYNQITMPACTSSAYISGATQHVWLNAGDVVNWVQACSATGNPSTTTASYGWIEKGSGSTTIGAGDSLYVQASTAAGQTLGLSGNVVVYGTVSASSHGTAAYNPSTGVFTAPTAGNYRFTAAICTATYTPAANNQINILLRKGGVAIKELACINTLQVSGNYRVSGSHEIYLLAGETVDMFAASNTTATTLYTDPKYNTLAISKVG